MVARSLILFCRAFFSQKNTNFFEQMFFKDFKAIKLKSSKSAVRVVPIVQYFSKIVPVTNGLLF